MGTDIAHNISDLSVAMGILPKYVESFILDNRLEDRVIEVLLDAERNPVIRTNDNLHLKIEDIFVSLSDIEAVMRHSAVFHSPRKNRAFVENTIHRISILYDLNYRPIGLTFRIGRVYSTGMFLLEQLLASDNGFLIIGRPGSGKSSRLREVARFLSTNLDKNVMIVDTNNEIAGGGTVPHYAVGESRRLMIPYDKTVFEVMLEAVENHMPEYVIVDEISSRKEAMAVQSIAERGVKVIATVHGDSLETVISNREIGYMLGKIRANTISDVTAKKSNEGSKIRLEREFPPSFGSAVELDGFFQAKIYFDLQNSIDAVLRGEAPIPDIKRA